MAKSRPSKTQPRVDAQRVMQALLSRTSVRGLNAETLASYLDNFDLGYLRYADIAWQRIRDRDDTVKAVTEKRELDCALLNYEILAVDDSPEATTDKAALEEFYNGLVTTHALDHNQRGGVSTLIRQMMHSCGHKYAVHEIVWQPDAESLTAEFRFVPLQFFENTQGVLRFLDQDYTYPGSDLEEGGWMVTTGAGLMIATSIAYLFKQQPLRAWLILCDKFAVPYLHGETAAAYGSKEWNNFRDALAAFVSDGAVVTSPGAKITPIQLTGAETSSKDLVDRMDRAISRIWRGSDLSTMSQHGSANGSNPQQQESEILAAADAQIISETLNHYVDQYVIRYRFGRAPKAYFKLQPQVDQNLDLEIKIDAALISWGVPRGKKDLLVKYGRPEPDPKDELATPAPAPAAFTPVANEAAATRAALFNNAAIRVLTAAHVKAFQPFIKRGLALLAETDDAKWDTGLAQLKADLPAIGKQILSADATGQLAKAWESILGPALVSGAGEAAQKQKSSA